MEKKKLTKQDIMASDAVYIVFSIVIAFCFIACAVVSIFLIVSSCIWIVKSFSLDEGTIKALALSVLMLLSSALFVWLDYRIFITVKSSITSYLKERKEILQDIEEDSTKQE